MNPGRKSGKYPWRRQTIIWKRCARQPESLRRVFPCVSCRQAVRETAGIIAAGVSLCILSPVSLILLLGLAEAGGLAFSENAAVAAGISVLLLMVSCAVALFVIWGKKLEAWEYLEAEPIELSYGVKGAVEKKKFF